MRRKTHERILADHERRWLERERVLLNTIEGLNDRLMWLVGVPYESNRTAPQPDEPEVPIDELPLTSAEQYTADDLEPELY